MSKFYTEIAKYYDTIFPMGKAQLDLIEEIAGQAPKDILDVACGSGGYSKELNHHGYTVTAIDLDEEMVQSLKEKSSDIDARVLNMLEIDKLNKSFDVIFCIGNSLVHLNDNEEILQFFKTCKEVLKPNGQIIIQVINYDRILAKDVKSLPLIENHEVNLTFERYYDYLPDKHKINFRTILKVNEEQLENQVLLHPVKSGELEDLFRISGFINVNMYGNFKKDPYDPMNSVPLVITAQVNS